MGRNKFTAATDEDATLEGLSKGWPKVLQRHPLHMQHTLIKSLRPAYSCDRCRAYGKNWSFLCATCDFDLHPNCALEAQLAETAKPWPRTVQHTLHRAHPLVKTRLATFWCDSCAERGSRWCFYCEQCDFSLHLQCAFGPEATRTLDKDRQQPPEKLTLEIVKTAMESYWCSNCAEEGKGACYRCEDYGLDLHPGCATKGNQWPRSIVRKDHEHELVKSRSDKYYCVNCWAEGRGCSFRCVDCGFGLHPRCATEEEVEGPGSWVEEVLHLRKTEEMLQKFEQEPAQWQLVITGNGTEQDDDGDNSVAYNQRELPLKCAEEEAMQRESAELMRLHIECLDSIKQQAFDRALQTADTMEKLSRLVR